MRVQRRRKGQEKQARAAHLPTINITGHGNGAIRDRTLHPPSYMSFLPRDVNASTSLLHLLKVPSVTRMCACTCVCYL